MKTINFYLSRNDENIPIIISIHIIVDVIEKETQFYLLTMSHRLCVIIELIFIVFNELPNLQKNKYDKRLILTVYKVYLLITLSQFGDITSRNKLQIANSQLSHTELIYNDPRNYIPTIYT